MAHGNLEAGVEQFGMDHGSLNKDSPRARVARQLSESGSCATPPSHFDNDTSLRPQLQSVIGAPTRISRVSRSDRLAVHDKPNTVALQ